MSIPAPTVTVSSGYWNNTMPTSYHREATEYRIGQLLGRAGARGLRKVMRALNGVAPGASVTDTKAQIAAGTAFNTTSWGGVRTIETVTGIHNGTTTTAQKDYINANIYDAVPAAQPYPTDLSGNGGGGKVQR